MRQITRAAAVAADALLSAGHGNMIEITS